jgi:hypothetical protein
MKSLNSRLNSSSLLSSRVSNRIKRLSSKFRRSMVSTLKKRKNRLDHNVCEVNDEGLPLDTRVNTRLSRVCGLAAKQRVSLTLQGFDELTKNEKVKLFENSIQVYAQYPEELKQKGKKLGTKIISHAWRSYKSKLVKIWRNQDTPFNTYKELLEEDRVHAVENFTANNEYMQWLRSKNELDCHLGNTSYARKQRE